MLRVWS